MQASINLRCPSCGTLNRVPADRAGDAGRCGQCHAALPRAGGSPVDVTDADFGRTVEGSALPVMVEFWSPSCGHCLRMDPVLKDLARELSGRAVVAKLDITKNPASAMRYEIRGTPAFVVVKGGREAGRFVGAMPREDLLNRLRPYI
ncbi:MAG: thioredoxin fold domain-containing protein [Nitrospirae bacterium]|nr:thioredoxin fold domain-containing protein [Nitrospirota bacterium]